MVLIIYASGACAIEVADLSLSDIDRLGPFNRLFPACSRSACCMKTDTEDRIRPRIALLVIDNGVVLPSVMLVSDAGDISVPDLIILALSFYSPVDSPFQTMDVRTETVLGLSIWRICSLDYRL